MNISPIKLHPHIEALREPWCWQEEIAHNTDSLAASQQLALDGNGIAAIFLPNRVQERISELSTITSSRINGSDSVRIGEQDTRSMYHLALTGGGVPFASMLGFEIARQDPHTPYRVGYTNMSRYGNKQTGADVLDIKQAPIAESIEDMDVVLTDDLIDHGTTLLLGAKFLVENGVPYCDIGIFLQKAHQEGILSTDRLIDLELFYRSLHRNNEAKSAVAHPSSVSALVLADKQHNPDFEDIFTFTDVGLLVPKPWLKRMGMDGPNEDGRWGEGIILSGTQELKYAEDVSSIIDQLGDLAVMSMDEKVNGVFWLEDGKPTKLPKIYL